MSEALCLDRNLVLVVGDEVGLTFVGGHKTYDTHIVHILNFVIIRLFYGEEEFVVFATVECGNAWYDVEVLGGLYCLLVHRDTFFVNGAAHL